VNFEWETEKAATNLRKHRVSFEEATTAFGDPLSATYYDPAHSVGESRYITIGLSRSGRLLVIAHTDRGENIRIISARQATRREIRQHEKAN